MKPEFRGVNTATVRRVARNSRSDNGPRFVLLEQLGLKIRSRPHRGKSKQQNESLGPSNGFSILPALPESLDDSDDDGHGPPKEKWERYKDDSAGDHWYWMQHEWGHRYFVDQWQSQA